VHASITHSLISSFFLYFFPFFLFYFTLPGVSLKREAQLAAAHALTLSALLPSDDDDATWRASGGDGDDDDGDGDGDDDAPIVDGEVVRRPLSAAALEIRMLRCAVRDLQANSDDQVGTF
jgi:hypothetical protein